MNEGLLWARFLKGIECAVEQFAGVAGVAVLDLIR
jgi:hypothetical protein